MAGDTIGKAAMGYGAVVIPHLDEYQGFFLIDDPAIHKEAVLLQFASMGSGTHPIGALQAAVVEGVITKNWHLVGVAALALHGMTKDKFFVIEATMASGGTRTKMFPMKATTIDEARTELEGWPKVRELKVRLAKKLAARKH